MSTWYALSILLAIGLKLLMVYDIGELHHVDVLDALLVSQWHCDIVTVLVFSFIRCIRQPSLPFAFCCVRCVCCVCCALCVCCVVCCLLSCYVGSILFVLFALIAALFVFSRLICLVCLCGFGTFAFNPFVSYALLST